MLYPKPAKKKQKKAKNNPVPTEQDKCFVCGAIYAETHEAFHGRGKRQLSIKYGLQCKLCYKHHRDPKTGVHYDPAFDFFIKQKYQQKFEETHSRKEFIQLFGRNYLDMTFEEYKKKGVDVA